MQWHQFDDEDLRACKRVLDSGQLCSIGGSEVPAFEEEFRQAMGAPLALAVCNAMAGLHCAVVASGADHGDEVIVDPLVTFASLGALYHHCTPVYCDVEPDTHLMDPQRLPELITDRTRAIIVTQLWGLCADMDAINAIAREHDLLVIEDCAHAIYATYNGQYAGTLGDVGVYSFQQSKQMALGDAGMTVMRTEEHRRVMEEMITFGTVPARLGWNYRLNELVAAVGRVQLTRAREYVRMCQEAAAVYNKAVADCEWIAAQAERPGRENTYHIWAAVFEGEEHGISREDFTQALRDHEVAMNVGYIERPAYAHDCIGQYLDDEPYCEVAEHIMPRLM
ncbi:MAG: DegT/DnrJ/EryC1/StrS family aminotransferase, partial [Armatimonadota bacterium]